MEDNTGSNSILLILLGALITFISTNIIEYIKEWRKRRSDTKNFKLFIKLELAVMNKTLEKLQTGLQYGSFYDYTLLDRVKESIDNLEKVRSDVIYLSDPELKEKFIEIISDISTYIAMVRVIQQVFYDNRNKALGSVPINPDPQKTGGRKKNNNSQNQTTLEQVVDTFNKSKTEKSIEYIEIKRKLENLIKSLN